MKAYVYDRYGPPQNLRPAEVPTPVPNDNQALVKIHAVSINGSDRENLAGKPFYTRFTGLLRPADPILGSDIAGTVEAVGVNHTEFKPGDAVYGEIPGYHGGFAEYFCTDGHTLAHKPEGLSFEEAASIPQGGVIAWKGIVGTGRVRPGQQVLINGAGGSAGAFAIQLAKQAGAEVTGVDNAHKQDFMREIGADQVLDFKHTNYTRLNNQFDLVLDLIAYRTVFAYARPVKPGGTFYFTGGAFNLLFQILVFGPLIRALTKKHVRILSVPQNRADLLEIGALCESGAVRVMVDRVFPFKETVEAMRYVADGRALGKVVIRMM